MMASSFLPALIAALPIVKTNCVSSAVNAHCFENIYLPTMSAFLKLDSPESFTVLITLPDSEFINNSMRKAYTEIAEIEDKFNNENYNIEFSICGTNETNFSEECVISDGYALKFKEINE